MTPSGSCVLIIYWVHLLVFQPCAAAALGIKNKVGEVLLLGFGAEVVVSDAVPLVVEEADKTNDEEERQANSKAGEAN